MRTEIPFNHGWLFAPEQLPLDAPDSAFEPVTLPHTNITLPHHNFDNADYQFISTYRKRFTLPEPRNGRRVFLDFDGAMLVTTVYVNGKQVGVNAGGYTPFSFDVTDVIVENGENVVTVHLDSTERPDVPPFGYVVDYLTFGGIYRDVTLRMVEPVYIKDVVVKTENILSDPEVWTIVYLSGDFSGEITVDLWDADLETQRTQENTLDSMVGSEGFDNLPRKTEFWSGDEHLKGKIQNWDLQNPKQYKITVQLRTNRQQVIDELTVDFGFRHVEFRDDLFYLNGERIQLRGLNRHQTYPYIGAAAPPRLQAQDADIIKYELGCNIVRTSHYPQSPHFLRRCDEIGLLVFEEIPGWQHIGDEDWQAISLRDVQAMIQRDRNHPSIIMWGVRINESQDDDSFYRKTNALAHELDPTRPTTGVRYFQDSSFLEDVFGFNDFSNGVEDPKQTPHLITEYNGHMFPTKTFDGEERKMEHARRHAHIQNLAYGNPRVSGAIGWCAFDYNTHKEFGSGDRICYHGVMDIFRMPKWAAAVCASQQNPAQKVVLQAATHWTMGDRSEGGNDPIHVYSNVDEIDVYFGEQHLGRFYPDRETYPHLPHPPFNVTGLQMIMMWGQAFGALRIVGYINGGQVAEQHISSDGVPKQLVLTADFTDLHADGADMTPLKVRITDAFGNTLPYAQQAVTFELAFTPSDAGAQHTAPLLIGENPLVLPGGQGAVYLKAGQTPGTATVTARTPRLPAQSVTVQFR